MKITFNTNDRNGLGTASIKYEGLYVSDGIDELNKVLKILLEMDDKLNQVEIDNRCQDPKRTVVKK